jgi:hypothetical protein
MYVQVNENFLDALDAFLDGLRSLELQFVYGSIALIGQFIEDVVMFSVQQTADTINYHVVRSLADPCSAGRPTTPYMVTKARTKSKLRRNFPLTRPNWKNLVQYIDCFLCPASTGKWAPISCPIRNNFQNKVYFRETIVGINSNEPGRTVEF